MSNKPKQGDTLYLDVTAFSRDPKIKPVTVSKVGRRYFYINDDVEPYDIHDLKYTNSVNSDYNLQLYRTEQEIHDMHQRIYLRGMVYHEVMQNRHLLTLDQLQRINNILNENK